MNKRGWSIRALGRYALFQLPGIFCLILMLLVVRRWLDLPAWFIFGLIGFWVMKDVVMFPFVWRAYESTPPKFVDAVIGAHGVAEERLASSGYVRVRDELWKARVIGSREIRKGETVRIRGIQGLTLLVEPEDEPKDDYPH
jgi:membrane protein implicated in regulation of membrane protease activity